MDTASLLGVLKAMQGTGQLPRQIIRGLTVPLRLDVAGRRPGEHTPIRRLFMLQGVPKATGSRSSTFWNKSSRACS